MRMCRWMGSHFHHWIDHNRVVFSIALLERGCTFFLIFGVRQFSILTVSKLTRMFVLYVKSKVFFIQYRVDSIESD